jgi:hypothetical protein
LLAAAVQEIVLRQQQVAAHMDAFGEVKSQAMADHCCCRSCRCVLPSVQELVRLQQQVAAHIYAFAVFTCMCYHELTTAAAVCCVSQTVQEIVLLQQQVQAHMDAFGEVKWEAMAAEQFGGRRHQQKLRTVHTMLTRAKVGEVYLYLYLQRCMMLSAWCVRCGGFAQLSIMSCAVCERCLATACIGGVTFL